MEPPTSKLATPSPSTSTIPPALQHSPSPPPLQRSNTSSGQRGKISPMRRASGYKVASGASTSPTALREALDQKEEVKRLAQRLATRLQYAAFKVERGWTKHSLPEVENLYWRASKIGTSSMSTSASKTQPSPRDKVSGTASSGVTFGGNMARRPSGGSTRPAIARLPSQSDGTAHLRVQDTDANGGATRRPTDVDEDVFGASVPISRALPSVSKHHHAPTTAVIGLNGLPTPPPSAGTDLAKGGSASSSGAAVGKGLLADLRVSPTRQMQAARAASKPTAGGGSTYADFWDKLGASSPALRGGGGGEAAGLASARDKESGLAARGVKRGREGGEEDEGRRPTGATPHS
ncbi:hypothetical protein BCV69DRAFT_101326 [Microstroma glucosiphilum]|uniref:Uncharacterized protein n=1 Tax=Pseudomicrostroma glucosiphilum TaxID=1684307 RepID=A0A316UEU2_9BASI|nr:hypothetical protein BCV69DRAFT_101326 [Pseudomicrostroma glucosiphilum]PWN22921.1 hypothetical protein BCV69DRAFT_101326 [Pseudomicrostroma glucosiphilum]